MGHLLCSGKLLALTMSETAGNMVIDHAGCLHMGVDNGRANEGETPLLQVPADGVGYRTGGRDLFHRPPVILYGLAVHEPPYVVGKASALLLNFEKRACVGAGTIYLTAIANDPGVLKQGIQLPVFVARNFIRVETVEKFSIALPLSQDRDPGEASLCPLEKQKLEELAFIAHGYSPFVIMIVDVERITAAPVAANFHLPIPSLEY